MSISIDLYENKGRLLDGADNKVVDWVLKYGSAVSTSTK